MPLFQLIACTSHWRTAGTVLSGMLTLFEVQRNFFFQSVFLTKDGVVLKLGSPKPGTTSTESAILYFYQKSTKVPVSAEPREQNKLANIIGSFQNRLAISHS